MVDEQQKLDSFEAWKIFAAQKIMFWKILKKS